MCLIEASSTLTGTEPTTFGRIMRPCTMPATLWSWMCFSVENTFGAMSSRGKDLPISLYSLWRLRLGVADRLQRIAPLLVPLELVVEVSAADQLLVGGLLGGIGLGGDHAVVDDEIGRRHAELGRCHLEQHAPRFGGGHAHLDAAELQAGRAGRAALVHATCACRPCRR